MTNQILKFYKKPKLKNGTLILGSIKGPLFKRKKSKKDNATYKKEEEKK